MAHQNLTAGNCFEQPQVKTLTNVHCGSQFGNVMTDLLLREHFSYPESRDSKMKDAIVGEKWNSTSFSRLAKKKLFNEEEITQCLYEIG